MTTIIIGLVIFNILNIPIYRFLFRKFFADSNEFNEVVKYALTPDLFSMVKGKYWKDKTAEIQLLLFFLSCGLLLAGEIYLLKAVVDWFTI